MWLTRSARRCVLANDAGFRQTVQGHRTLRRTRREMSGHSLTVDDSTAHDAAEFTRSGVRRFDSTADTDLVDRVAARFAELTTDDEVCSDQGRAIQPDLHRYVTHAHQRIPELTELLTPEVARTIEAAYGCCFRVRSVRAYRNSGTAHARSDDNVYANQWHLDPELTCDLRYFVYLSDADVRNGALETIDRPTTRKILRSGYVGPHHIVGPARRLMSHGAVTHEGPAGTGVLVQAEHVLHRAGTCADGSHRDAVQFWITPSPVPLPDDWGTQLPEDRAFLGGRPGDG